MKKVYYFLFICCALNFNLLFSQTVSKVLISGDGNNVQHENDVTDAFMIGYSSYDNTNFGGSINLYTGIVDSSFIYANYNNYDVIIRSYTGLEDAIPIASDYPSIKLFMPSGSNSFEETFTGDVENSPIIITGAGVDHNVTGYQIEFFSIDPIYNNNLSSFANGYIAGQIAYIANTLNCSVEQARLLARSTGSNNGIFDYYNGYGKINIANALNIGLPIELSSFTANYNKDKIVLEWETKTEVNNYGFDVERSFSSLGTRWETIGFVEGNGNSNSPKYYNFTDNNIVKTGAYNYRLKQIDNDGTYKYSNIVYVNVSSPDNYYLSQNYPNPFNPTTTISWQSPEGSRQTLKLFDILGNEVSTLVDEYRPAGNYEITFIANRLPSGMYFYQLKSGTHTETKKMILLK